MSPSSSSPDTRWQLADWLVYIQRLHPSEIELGLQRIRLVWAQMGSPALADQVFVVAGTNGKGSIVTYIDAVLRAAGYRVGAYTSPHVRHFSERIQLLGLPADDLELCRAFELVERARGQVSLSFFEYTTLAALWLFAEANLDCVVLEVGLGGRLDAVNIIDANVSVIASIGLDHQAWLGSDLRGIAREKAGVMRVGRPTVIASPHAADLLDDHIAEIGAVAHVADRDYMATVERGKAAWTLTLPNQTLGGLPMPSLAGDVQVGNAAAALVAIHCSGMNVAEQAIRTGLGTAQLAGRIQTVAHRPDVVVDVCHNTDSAQTLARWLRTQPKKRTLAVFGVMKDKDLLSMVEPLQPLVDHWFACAPQLARSLPVADVARDLRSAHCDVRPCDSVASAVNLALAEATASDRVIVIGSFHTADEALAALDQRQ